MTSRIFQSGNRRLQRARLVFSMSRSGRHLRGSLSDNTPSDPGRRFLRKLLDGVVELRGPARTSPSALLTQTFKTLSCARYRYGLKQIGVLRLRLGGISAHAPCWRAGSLIQSALYPRHASNIVCGSKAPRRLAIYGRSVRVGIVPLF